MCSIKDLNEITNVLFSHRDTEYQSFASSLIPNVDPSLVIGVRTPELRRLAKEITKFSKNTADKFVLDLPHKYYEENNLHAFIISETKDFEECVTLVDSFLPFVNNWATCDGLRPSCFKSKQTELMPYIQKWLSSSHPYTIRFGIEMLMLHYLDDDFSEDFLNSVSKISSDDYYVNMMIAWYFATALAKQWECAVKYLEDKLLPEWIHQKTIQKAIESYRITESQKNYLKSLKIQTKKVKLLEKAKNI